MLLNKEQRKNVLKDYEKKFKKGLINKSELDDMKNKIKQMGKDFAAEHLRNIELIDIEHINKSRESKYKMYLELYSNDEEKAKNALVESERQESIKNDKKLFR